jgi:hypothetical protein
MADMYVNNGTSRSRCERRDSRAAEWLRISAVTVSLESETFPAACEHEDRAPRV